MPLKSSCQVIQGGSPRNSRGLADTADDCVYSRDVGPRDRSARADMMGATLTKRGRS